MADAAEGVRLHHWTYGVTPERGYGVKAASTGLNISLFEAPLRGRYTPLRGDVIQSEGGVNSRMIHPASSGDDVLLSHLGRGPPDELGRPTFQNHIAIVPAEVLATGRASLGSVDGAIAAFDAAHGNIVGDMGPLEVAPPPPGYRPGAGLRQHLTRAAVETLATRRIREQDGRTLLLCRETPPAVRNEVLFRVVELLNILAGLEPFTAMSDAPTASALNTFDLVVAPRGLRGDNSWAIIESSLDRPPLPRVDEQQQVYDAIERSFAADTAAFG